MRDHKAKALQLASLDNMSAARMGTEQAAVRVQVAQVHATLALAEAADAQVAATKAQTAALERLLRAPRPVGL